MGGGLGGGGGGGGGGDNLTHCVGMEKETEMKREKNIRISLSFSRK